MGLHLQANSIIGIYEVSEPGHPTLVDSVCRIFSSNPNLQVNLHVDRTKFDRYSPHIKSIGRDNLTLNDSQVDPNETLRIITTPDGAIEKSLSLAQNKAGTVMFIHNTDEWFDLSIWDALKKGKSALFQDKSMRLAYYYVKRHLKEVNKRKQLINAISKNESSSFAVLNSKLKKSLLEKVEHNRVLILPFSVYNSDLPVKEFDPKNIRICIPGMLSQKRRDYLSLFQVLKSLGEEEKAKLEIDLLGGVSNAAIDRSQELIAETKKLQAEGYRIIIREKPFIDLLEFDQELSKCDYVLGNLNIDQGGGSKYGQTKESGIPFTMIRAGKPGILPSGYFIPHELKAVAIQFQNYASLSNILSLDFLTAHYPSSNNLSRITKAYSDEVILSKLDITC